MLHWPPVAVAEQMDVRELEVAPSRIISRRVRIVDSTLRAPTRSVFTVSSSSWCASLVEDVRKAERAAGIVERGEEDVGLGLQRSS